MPAYLDVFISPIRDNSFAQILLVALMFGIVGDIVSGFIGAAVNNDINSSKMRKGIWHKLAEIMFVFVADVIDGLLLGGLQIGMQPVLVGTLLFLVFMELFSILENLVKASPDLAKVPIFSKLSQAVKEMEEDKNEQ
jgi:toxin secretion/phage lysis holin